jgi:ATPase subunit of ABC transporter with duplicated ATPase domains
MFAKPLASIAIILFSATLVTAEANAGGCHGGFRAFSAMQNHNYIIKRQQSLAAAKQRQQAIAAARARQQKAAIAAASRKAEAAKVAKAEIKKDETPAAKVAETTTTETSTTTKVAVAETTCKKFVPAIGVTVDVACGTN